ncbi:MULTISPECIES: hypothetical protein [Paenarthrobacter]|uniref:Uncharacterized protein n=1 Tax=Paenarthrobacter ureafaciens TaxID=37931 RepID=A0AAX3ERJ0_PAEUR|nr:MULTISPECIES: hypothetical protein [Paenarthrobacter]MDO5878147.1 hypothetical protein [Paenarthrobacter sp. SD-1]NHW49316.1 hypothetical protein [Paenarthrobacter sp. MSM-2-10-13]UYW00015.1 hypothetical protein NL394_23000 [Paenarthrobacter ureafaciens]
MSKELRPPAGDQGKNLETFTGPPRWVKVSAIVTGILLLVVVAVMILSGGEHGPGRHGFGLGTQESSTSATSGGRPARPGFFVGAV